MKYTRPIAAIIFSLLSVALMIYQFEWWYIRGPISAERVWALRLFLFASFLTFAGFLVLWPSRVAVTTIVIVCLLGPEAIDLIDALIQGSPYAPATSMSIFLAYLRNVLLITLLALFAAHIRR